LCCGEIRLGSIQADCTKIARTHRDSSGKRILTAPGKPSSTALNENILMASSYRVTMGASYLGTVSLNAPQSNLTAAQIKAIPSKCKTSYSTYPSPTPTTSNSGGPVMLSPTPTTPPTAISPIKEPPTQTPTPTRTPTPPVPMGSCQCDLGRVTQNRCGTGSTATCSGSTTCSCSGGTTQ
jgi:hypothetical protein